VEPNTDNRFRSKRVIPAETQNEVAAGQTGQFVLRDRGDRGDPDTRRGGAMATVWTALAVEAGAAVVVSASLAAWARRRFSLRAQPIGNSA
jgi:hypothetical protein